VIANSYFDLYLAADREESWSYYDMHTFIYEAGAPKYKYLTAHSERDPCWRFLATKLDDLTRTELEKLGEEEKASLAGQGTPDMAFFKYNPSFKKPSAWTFYDHLVPRWHEE